ncbi:MAG: beta-Ala-His dipeptidase [Candidatus Lokiarchaeota archaeon]|nr:beta-Ala-His dipeptidase [Candidatus Lokiarchaeota archaeon]
MVLENLEPKIVWNIFEYIISSTPRPSKHEEMIRNKIKSWLKEQAKLKSLEFSINQDSVGNILIKKTATKGMESASSIVLQAHMDMVCETDKPEGFDFMNSGIPIRIQDNLEWVDADGTTLGADDGIGIALALAALVDQSIKTHGPIEVLLTVNEEDGFDGATQLDPVALDIQSKLMINLDGGPLGDIVIGSVCGRRIRFSKKFNWIDTKESDELEFYEISVQGLLSGHSGEDIHFPRANANKLAGRILSNISQEMKIFVSKWQGGTKSNVIPAKSSIILGILSKNKKKFEEMLNEEISLTFQYYEKLEPNLKIKYKKALSRKHLSEDESKLLISTVNIIPHGVLKKSSIYDKFIESSNNLGIINTEKETEIIWLYPRSMIRSELNSFCVSIKQLGEIGGWDVFLRPILPEWLPDLESNFLNYVKTEYEELLKKNVKTRVIHGGLETGMINTRVSGLQMVSLGPTVEDLHSPSEKLRIADVGVLYTLIKKIIENILKLSQ